MDIDAFDATHGQADVNGIRMHYVEKGDGPLVVLLHGFPEHWWSWRYQIGPIAAAGFRVVAPDLRGYNETERRGPYDIDTLCADVRGLIEACGAQRAAVVAHDWGGAVAWHLAATMPACCERLSIVNAPHPTVFRRSILSSAAQRRRSWYMGFFMVPGLPEAWLTRDDAALVERIYRGMAVDSRRVVSSEVRPFRDAIQEPGAARAMLAYYRVNLGRALVGLGPRGKYPRITVPTQVIWGIEDKALGFYDQVPGMASFVDQLEIERIEDAGHFVQSERPDELNARLIPFLQRPARG